MANPSTPQNKSAVSLLQWGPDDQADPAIVSRGSEILDVVYVAGAAITKGHWVMLDVSVVTTFAKYQTCIKAAGALNPMVIGVAMNAAADAGDHVRVRRRGPITPDDGVNVYVLTASAAQDSLEMSATDGAAGTVTAETEREIGVAYSEPANDIATWVEVRCL
ncbi:MAG: DUF2190 family protein [bacterium]|nr:DUF2190 family protein [bacterium]